MRESKEKEKAGAAINFKFLKHLTMHTNVGETGTGREQRRQLRQAIHNEKRKEEKMEKKGERKEGREIADKLR